MCMFKFSDSDQMNLIIIIIGQRSSLILDPNLKMPALQQPIFPQRMND